MAVLEQIGLRAVIIDVRQYLADGRKITQLNEQIANASNKASAQSVSSSRATVAAINAEVKAQQARTRAALDALTAQKAQASAAAAATGRNLQGRFISKDQQGQAVLFAATAQKDLQRSVTAANKASREEITLASQAAKAETLRTSALERQIIVEQRLAETQRARLRAGASAAAIVGVAVATGIGAAAVVSAANYEQILVRIDTLTEATTEQTKSLGAEILKLSGDIPVEPAKLAEAAYFALSSGIKDVGIAQQIAEQAGKAQTAQLGDAVEVAQFMTSTMNAYGVGTLKATQITDMLTAAVQQGAGAPKDYAEQLGRVTGVAATLGVGLDEVLAITASLTNTLKNVPEAVTGVLGILTHLNRVAPQSEEAFAGIGLSINDVKQTIAQGGLIPFLQDLANKLEDNDQALGDVFQDRRAVNAFFQAFREGNQTTVILDKIRKSVGLTEEAFKANLETTKAQAQVFKNTLNIALIEAGTVALPAVNRALKDLVAIIIENKTAIVDFISVGLQVAIQVFRDFVAGIALVVKALSAIDGVLKAIVGDKAATVAAIVAIGAALTWALPGGPILKGIGLIILGLGQIAAATKTPVEDEVKSLLKGQSGADKALGKITPNFLQSANFKAAEKIVADLKNLGITTVEEYEKYTNAQKKANDANKDATNEIEKKTQAEQLNNTAVKQAREEIKALQEAFKSSSEAAGQVKSVVNEFGTFGVVTQALASTLASAGASIEETAIIAGNVQGFSAFVSAIERADSSAFNFTAALATVAAAFERSASVASQIVTQMAQSALSAAQAAASALFSRPTREVANLQSQLANQRKSSGSQSSGGGRSKELEDRLKDINEQIKNAQKEDKKRKADETKAKKDRDKAEKAAKDAAKRAEEAARDAAQRQLDEIKLGNLQARHAYERFNEHLEALIEAANEQASDLQEAFLKSNEDLQRQIQTAIGQGDTAGALALVEQQRTQADAYNTQADAIQDNIDVLEKQQRVAARAEAERQRQAELQEAFAQAAFRAGQAARDNAGATEESTESTDENTEATDASTEGLEAQKKAIEDELAAESEKKQQIEDQSQAIQDQIDAYLLETEALKAMITASDQTLLTQAEQAKAAQEIASQIRFASGIIRANATSVLDLLPGVDSKALREQFDLLQKMVQVTTDEAFRDTLIDRILRR